MRTVGGTVKSERDKVLLLDGHSLAYRAFFALPVSMSTSGGQPTNAAYGFTSMLLKVLDEERPGAVAVAFDGPRSDLIRTREFPEYKAHRPSMPQEMRDQMPIIERLLSSMGIPVLRAVGYEADDILATVARRAAVSGRHAVIVTGDRDVLQVVDENITVLMTGKGITETVTYDRDAVIQKYGVVPEKLPEMAGLKGDASDNIPGVPGIGEKGASALIREHGSLEGVYENIESVGGAGRRSSLQENREVAFLSRELSRLETEVPIDVDLDEMEFGKWDEKTVVDYLSGLEFRTLAKRFQELFGSGEEDGSTGRSRAFSLELVDAGSDGQLRSFTREAVETGAVGVAGACYGAGFCEVELRSVAIASGLRALVLDEGSSGEAWAAASEILGSFEVKKRVHDGKSLMQALGKKGIPISGVIFDTAVAAYIENPSLGSYSLRDVWERNLGGAIEIAGERQEDEEQPSLLEVSDRGAGLGAAADAARVFLLKPVMEEKLGSIGALPLFEQIEMPLMLVLKEMEETGVALERRVPVELSAEAAAALADLEEEIHRLAGREFNIGSTKQLSEVLFGDLGIPPVRKTRTGYSTDSSVLETLKGEYPIAEKILEFREYSKLKSTYLDVLPALVCPSTGRIHCSFNQTATATGRISSSGPNLQNIPVRTDVGRKIRAAFVAGFPDWKMLVADYSQIELRVLAHLSGDERLVEAFNSDRDIHSETAVEVFGVPYEQVTPEMRRAAKVVNFGVVYGMGYYGLSSRLGITLEDATRYIDSYFETYRGVREYRDQCIASAARLGYAETMFGRRRPVPELASGNRATRELGERLAINTPLQGTAADMIKKAMVDVAASIQAEGMDSRLTLQIHDELLLEAPLRELEALTDIVGECMTGVAPLRVPLKVNMGVYRNWGEAKG